MAKRADMILGVLLILALFILMAGSREGLENPEKITASVSNPSTDGRSITMTYTYSASKAPTPRAKAAIRKIDYLDKSGKTIGSVDSPAGTDANIPQSGQGNRRSIVNPPQGVNIADVDKLSVVSYVYYVDNTSGTPTGEQSDDITTSIPVSA